MVDDMMTPHEVALQAEARELHKALDVQYRCVDTINVKYGELVDKLAEATKTAAKYEQAYQVSKLRAEAMEEQAMKNGRRLQEVRELLRDADPLEHCDIACDYCIEVSNRICDELRKGHKKYCSLQGQLVEDCPVCRPKAQK